MSVMTSFRIGGRLISLTCVVLAALFVWGIVAGEPWRFWAIAAPVILGLSVALGIGFQIGRLMSSTNVAESPGAQSEGQSASSTTPQQQ
ncbi:MAG: hypothetical protein V3S51_07870 [Dehalococcoidia bacterium]